MLVSLEAAKKRLKFDDAAEDDDLELAIEGASAAVMKYLDVSADVWEEDSSGVVPDVPPVVANAVLALVGIWKRDPSGVDMKEWEMGYLPAPVTALLYPLRDPSLG
jgi:hypothetical protein